MTITYPTGAVREATLLNGGDDTLKVVTCDGKIREFKQLRDGWYSEACEPVTILFYAAIGV